MFYPNDFITKNIRTQQINEYVRQAEQDHLLAKLNGNRSNLLIELARGTRHVIAHLLAATSRRANPVQVTRVRSAATIK